MLDLNIFLMGQSLTFFNVGGNCIYSMLDIIINGVWIL